MSSFNVSFWIAMIELAAGVRPSQLKVILELEMIQDFEKIYTRVTKSGIDTESQMDQLQLKQLKEFYPFFQVQAV